MRDEAALSHCGKSLGLDVLVVDDDKNIRATLRVCLEALGCKLVEAANGAGVRAALGLGRFDLAFVDVRLGREDGLDLLPTLLAIDPPVDVIVISAHADIDSAVRAMKLGASGFVPKPFSREQIETIAEKVAHERAVRRRIAERRRKLDESAPEIDLQTQSPKMQRALDVAARAAPHRAPVLLRGERGTGKAVLARRIHALSTFAAGPFMAVRCATVDEQQLARDGGLDASAARGTVYLDEVAAAPPRLQQSLVRIIRDGTVRIVAATGRDPLREVKAGRLRADLAGALLPLEIELPPLRERRDDILPHARRLLAFRVRDEPLPLPELDDQAERALVDYSWPGNLDELRLAMERAALLRAGARVGLEALPERIAAPTLRVPYVGGGFTLDDIEREHILRVLATAPMLDDAARILGIDTSTLWRKRKLYQV
jgi:NtrC-family two-component system response regulator AlgB